MNFDEWLERERDIGVEYNEHQLWAARIAYRDATAAERELWIAAVNRITPRYALAVLHDVLPQEAD